MLACFQQRWLDKLGVSARNSVSVVIRQCLYFHYYGLVDDNMDPNPVRAQNKSDILLNAYEFSVAICELESHRHRALFVIGAVEVLN